MYIYELLEGDETIRSSMVEPLWHNLATCRCVNGGLVKKKIKKIMVMADGFYYGLFAYKVGKQLWNVIEGEIIIG